eukprot:CAMPEP_0202796064 /NCGR_PEP_ID=MMETSP1388-20130828/91308_1 /ASSEMBLY_ACC=CAM_ASM_000864 /TAXON_ID=37098 /ORGANISM="Isochrysis sp, Strain CCMP1244" /LENGTH=74 /DNA_ID=CAMNT_0049465955 /DNA_START=83 /DNA_END=304 /DNA_ORIENTATION=+
MVVACVSAAFASPAERSAPTKRSYAAWMARNRASVCAVCSASAAFASLSGWCTRQSRRYAARISAFVHRSSRPS